MVITLWVLKSLALKSAALTSVPLKSLAFLYPIYAAPGYTQYFVGWGTLSLINAGLAQCKKRSGLLWFILSLFLGPFATFLIVILPEG